MQIKLFIYKLDCLMKEKYPQIKIGFYCSHRKKLFSSDLIEHYFLFLNIQAV